MAKASDNFAHNLLGGNTAVSWAAAPTAAVPAQMMWSDASQVQWQETTSNATYSHASGLLNAAE